MGASAGAGGFVRRKTAYSPTKTNSLTASSGYAIRVAGGQPGSDSLSLCPMSIRTESVPQAGNKASGAKLPEYLRRTYTWAYLSPRTMPWLDRAPVVSAILWGNAGRLMRWAAAQFAPGEHVLQAACVYGDFSPMLARRVGPQGRLSIRDVAPIQIDNVRRKLAGLPQADAEVADLVDPLPTRYDAVCCFFLLHEVPEAERRRIVANLLAAVKPGGRAVFVDYHRPRPWHPLAPVMAGVFRWLEPFAESLLDEPLGTLADEAGDFEWHKQTRFGGLYQLVVARRR
jgi:SAM-dependent methyltransferase